jgi:hypothetical protein
MNFNEALEAIQANKTVTRRKWGGKAKVYIVNNKLNNINHVEVRTVNNCLMYAASSEDLLAMDWELVEKDVSKKQLNPDEIVL